MSTADEIRLVASTARLHLQRAEQEKAVREAEEKEAKRRQVMGRSDELFAPVLEQINEAASKGRTSYHHRYWHDNNKTRWEAEAVAEEAKSRGFKTEFKSEEANMGDSAAPGWTTFHWLEISW